MKKAALALWLGISLSFPAWAQGGSVPGFIQEILSRIEEMGLERGLATSLTQKLLNAQRSFERGDTAAAVGQVNAFRNEVEARRGRGLTQEQADLLMQGSRALLALLRPGPPPVLKNLVVEFGRWDPATNRAGAFLFQASEEKVFLEFGAVVTGPEGPKTLPTFEYRVSPDAAVVSPVDGTVEALEFQPSTNDYEILMFTDVHSPYTISIDHVKDLLVSVGQTVSAGQPLGRPGPWSPTLGRTELQLHGLLQDLNYCPFDFLDPGLAPSFQQKVLDHMSDWEAFKGDPNVYDQAAMVQPGCAAHTLGE